MARHDDLDLEEFGGVARLFPLPNLVLFPHVIHLLHIFEPRYRQMTQHALENDRLIAIVLLKPDWEADYAGRPEIHQMACLGRIMNEQRLPDGKYNFLLRGLCRLRIEHEIEDLNLYRSARVELLPDPTRPDQPKLRKMLLDQARRWFPATGTFAEQLERLAQSDLPLNALCDILAFALPLSMEIKQLVLEELDGDQRLKLLLEELRTGSPPEVLPMPQEKRRFPPDFSAN